MQMSSASNAPANVQKALLVPAFLISIPQSKLEQLELGFYGNVKEAIGLVILLVA